MILMSGLLITCRLGAQTPGVPASMLHDFVTVQGAAHVVMRPPSQNSGLICFNPHQLLEPAITGRVSTSCDRNSANVARAFVPIGSSRIVGLV